MKHEISQAGVKRAVGLQRGLRLVLASSVIALVVACTPVQRNHGYIPTEDMIAGLNVGDSRASVISAIGEPAAQSVQGQGAFYYVQSRFETFGAFAPREIDRQVLAVTFTPAGTLQNIARYGLQDGNVVILSRRVTDEQVGDMTFIRQLLGNFGRVDAASMLGTSE
ncbi:outer membrane protein assembly factor BamE [Ketogulonicigenium vulgare]|uniref:Lipoprotein, SmpA/OmlA family protein n=1 Tax=Ketogulonicigenium vulgare (strain WSH-001) TaxID=759362 RepID=F9Y5G4_KETVW|nr:outer membrane protein assembly factor BamE [Ketogulonicigenium vulgare]ADO42521.1 lipoprotein, SmpA/OmlA family [Ketogulonicigenium vulgare Y25]AEM40717.1 Lipoprotein, SmpA/OmlA family protein [Ketogulonicigenium vulgare WSH-001]ALJ80887.1 cell envelope protein SmpA [Ketogulonicigenium vulgare]ANW33659.1 cell envelope protein SmpA [Ketogulonicigenium vulgare]AOZ54434.1 lipoprotein, SmpA/OmlA family [Ketogulonicigenium vulgare]